MKFRNYRNLLRFLSHTTFAIALCLLIIAGGSMPVRAQSITNFDRERFRQMLDVIKSDIKKDYYDPNFHGINLDEHFKKADEKIKKAATNSQALGVIAQALLDFNDSHLFFAPPGRVAKVEYGWQMQVIGNKCFVTAVKPGSDAAAKGLKPGDEIYSVDGLEPTRENFWKLNYYYYSLRPKAGMLIVVQDPDGKQREIMAMAKVQEGKRVKNVSGTGSGEDIMAEIRDSENEARLRRHRYVSSIEGAFIWNMPQFDLSDHDVDSIIDKAKKHKALIVDLRGNSGGAETTLLRLIGNLFDHDVKIGELKRRKETKPLEAKTRGANSIYKGQVVVLIDNRSGSSAEIFARIVQLEKRGKVIGDRSAGAVMRSRFHQHESGVDIVAFYGVSVTDADLVMTDGKSLEHTGVTPDETVLPTGADLTAKRDIVLARAATLAGIELTSEKAGAFFPIEWKK